MSPTHCGHGVPIGHGYCGECDRMRAIREGGEVDDAPAPESSSEALLRRGAEAEPRHTALPGWLRERIARLGGRA